MTTGTTSALVDLGDGVMGMRTERASIRVDPVNGGRLSSLVIDGQEVRIGASVGVAVYPADGQTPDQLVDAADRSMYEAKRDRRGRARR